MKKTGKPTRENFMASRASKRSFLDLLRQTIKRIERFHGSHARYVDFAQLFTQAIVGNAEQSHLRGCFRRSLTPGLKDITGIPAAFQTRKDLLGPLDHGR